MTNLDALHLGVNIDHVATLRQVRGTTYPAPADVVTLVEEAGADSITVHLREDRRHIQDADIPAIQAVMQTHMNLECAVTEEMLAIAVQAAPRDVCLVPEKREELTTEGGLDVAGQLSKVRDACSQLSEAGIRASLFIDPDHAQLDAAVAAGAPVVELHTGSYAEETDAARRAELSRVVDAATYGHSLGLVVNAGHGLNVENVSPIAEITEIVELNIGHALVARAVFVGIAQAVREMKQCMQAARA